MVDYRFLFWCLGLLALREWKLMKVGDLVKQVSWDGVGVIIECQGDGGDGLGTYWRVLFGSELNYICENDLEVVSESG